jgi:hypothetical protein
VLLESARSPAQLASVRSALKPQWGLPEIGSQVNKRLRSPGTHRVRIYGRGEGVDRISPVLRSSSLPLMTNGHFGDSRQARYLRRSASS